jgi:hypothetical protein
MLDLALLHYIRYEGLYVPRSAAQRGAGSSTEVPWMLSTGN